MRTSQLMKPKCVMVWTLLLSICLFSFDVNASPAGPLTWGATATVKASGAGWGRMTRLSNGDWLAVYTVFPANVPTRLKIARSTDNARTWSTIATVATPGRDLDNGNLIQLPNGDVLLAMRSIISGQSYRLVAYRSQDGGYNWSYLSNIDSNEVAGGSTNRGLWEPSFNVLPNGSLSVLYANEKYAPTYSQVISQRISTDGGASWSAETWPVYQIGGGAARPGMPVMARMGDGRYILSFEVCGFGPCDVAYKISNDGVTWPAGLGTYIHYQRCGPYVLSTSDGRLIMTSCQNEVSYSNDYGATWLKNDPAAWPIGFSYSWPAIYQTGPNEIGIMNVTSGGAIQIRFGTLAPPTSGSHDFSDHFTDGNDAGWARYGQNFSVVNGVYQISNAPSAGNASSKAFAGDETYTSGVLETDMRLLSGSNAGLMFRTTNAGFGADEAEGYYVGLDASGEVVLGKQNNNWTTLASAGMNISYGVWYHVKVAFSGSRLKVYVNNMATPVINIVDSSFQRGQIGVRSHFANAQFDNVVFHRLLDVDNFQDGADNGWSRHGGNFGFSGGTYNLNNATTTGKSAWRSPSDDFTLEADIRLGSGPSDAGLIFRATNIGSGIDDMNGYYAGLNPNSDVLVLGRQDGSWTLLSAVPLQVQRGIWYRVKVVAMGGDIRVYVNDMRTPEIHVTDATWTSGAVGVRANYINASFDNVTVTR